PVGRPAAVRVSGKGPPFFDHWGRGAEGDRAGPPEGDLPAGLIHLEDGLAQRLDAIGADEVIGGRGGVVGLVRGGDDRGGVAGFERLESGGGRAAGGGGGGGGPGAGVGRGGGGRRGWSGRRAGRRAEGRGRGNMGWP